MKLSNETYAKIAHMDWQELSHAYAQLEEENAKLKRENKDMDFLLAKAYDLLEKASGKKDEFGAESQIWCMQYEDALLTEQEDDDENTG